MSDKQPDGGDAGPGPNVAASDAGATSAVTDPVEAPETDSLPGGRLVNELQAIRDALKARMAGVRAHLADARNGDHRATVSALTGLIDLVRDMLGPDRPEDSLRGALVDLAAGRVDDARKFLEVARSTLLAGKAHADMRNAGAVVDRIDDALFKLASDDHAACARLTQVALEIVGGG